MTGSTTHCCVNVPELSVLKRLMALVWTLLLLIPSSALADDRIRHAELVAGEDGYVVNADIDLNLNPRLVELISRGVSLHFSAQFEIEQPRWYWFDKSVMEHTLNYRIAYHAITRTYRLTVGNLHQSFDTLDSVVRTMQRIRNWRVADFSELVPGNTYRASLRLVHDTSMLPRPFLVTAIGSREWALDTDWMQWTFRAGTPP